MLRCSALPFTFTDGVWIRIPPITRCVWYRGIIVPGETTEFTIVVPLTMFEEAASWDMHVGVGYRRVPNHIEGRVGRGYNRVTDIIRDHFLST